ncbi:pyrimidine dimer DNA glycosylase/endonuclease V [Solibacillus sp. MA9]|uniref:Pyrimidine dimer DNA glycosylase/endonuclease V n=1 Tax=Solibacillus palustris TaxID=2908203 RepID=A0ABS9UDR1_9BACL|nr:pyrimidine dimer DNA glycosylase/endonuclease V [Solibacillus sp. MA9]MCH7322474.1 pyrimidine dimer DNA glycosylase/endonuclease V [Solibacillus sp. MA9]
MRLWHYELIPYLPKSQLLAQWRELNSIFAKEDKHILINYIYEYPKTDLYVYTELVLQEMKLRGVNIRTLDKMARYFEGIEIPTTYKPFAKHHNEPYLTICFYNLYEKFIRGQKDFSSEQFTTLETFYTLDKPISRNNNVK